MKKHITDELKAQGFAIYFSLSHSDVRTMVLLCVKHAGGKATIAEISEKTSISYTNVKRAVFGHKHTYSKKWSLIGTSLVDAEMTDDADIVIVSLTSKGFEVGKTLEDSGYEISLNDPGSE